MDSALLMHEMSVVRPDIFGVLVKTAEEVKESPYREDILSELDRLVKLAMGQLANRAAGVGAQVLQGIAFNLAGDMYDSLRRGITKSHNYKKMLAANPDLRSGGPKVRQAFDVLHQFNPEFSSNPTVAGSFVRNQSQLDNSQLGDLQTLTGLVSAHKSLADTRKLPVHQLSEWTREDPLDSQYKQQQILKLKQDMEQQQALNPHQIKKIIGEVEQLGKKNNEELFQAGLEKAKAEAKIQAIKASPQWMGMEKNKLRGGSAALRNAQLGQAQAGSYENQAALRQTMNALQGEQLSQAQLTRPTDLAADRARRLDEHVLGLELGKVHSPANQAAPFFSPIETGQMDAQGNPIMGPGPSERYIPGSRSRKK